MLTREDIQITVINDNSKNAGNKNMKSNRFLENEQVQSIKKLFELNVKGSTKIRFLKDILNMLKNLAWQIWPMRFIFNALV